MERKIARVERKKASGRVILSKIRVNEWETMRGGIYLYAESNDNDQIKENQENKI